MGCDGMDPGDEEKKKLNDEFVDFIRKRSETEAPRYTARLKTYVDIQRKRERANATRRRHEAGHEKTLASGSRKKDDEQKDKGLENNDHTGGDKERVGRRSAKSVAGETSEGSFRPGHGLRRSSSASTDGEDDPFCVEPFLAARLPARPTATLRDGERLMPRVRSCSRSRSGEPSDRCGRRRRRRRRSCRVYIDSTEDGERECGSQ